MEHEPTSQSNPDEDPRDNMGLDDNPSDYFAPESDYGNIDILLEALDEMGIPRERLFEVLHEKQLEREAQDLTKEDE